MGGRETYADRFPKYIEGAAEQAEFCVKFAAGAGFSASLNKRASYNSANHEDEIAADLYEEIGEILKDIQADYNVLASLYNKVRKHFEGSTIRS